MTKPDALRLATYLEGFFVAEQVHAQKAIEIAAELRRLHAENEALRKALEPFFAFEQSRDELQKDAEAARKALKLFIAYDTLPDDADMLTTMNAYHDAITAARAAITRLGITP